MWANARDDVRANGISYFYHIFVPSDCRRPIPIDWPIIRHLAFSYAADASGNAHVRGRQGPFDRNEGEITCIRSLSNRRSLRSTLLLGAASMAAVGLSAPAFAQDQSTEIVVVTGSRIPQQGLYAPSPVTSVGQQELKFEGTVGVETLLNNLPAVFANADSGRIERFVGHGDRQPPRPGLRAHAGSRQRHALDAG